MLAWLSGLEICPETHTGSQERDRELLLQKLPPRRAVLFPSLSASKPSSRFCRFPLLVPRSSLVSSSDFCFVSLWFSPSHSISQSINRHPNPPPNLLSALSFIPHENLKPSHQGLVKNFSSPPPSSHPIGFPLKPSLFRMKPGGID